MKKLINIFVFILINIYKSIILYKDNSLKKINIEYEDKDCIIKRTNHLEIKKVLSLYKSENSLILHKKILWFICPNLILHIYDKSDNKIIGFSSYYTSKLDLKLNNIHLAYYFLEKEYRRKKIGEKLIKFSIDYFQKKGFNGMSARVDKDNINSFNLLRKLEFNIIETYTDKSIKIKNLYLVKNFKE